MARSLPFRFLAPLAILALVIPAKASTVPVLSLNGSSSSAGWRTTYRASGGTAEIVDLYGLGGNLQHNGPDKNGAVKLTTTDNDSSRAEVALSQNFGKVSTLFNDSLNLSYSYFKESVSGGNASAAATLKLTFKGSGLFAPSLTLVYEPSWNQAIPGSSINPPVDEWTTASINLEEGVFWATGTGFGATAGAGGPPLHTLGEWSNILNSAFQNATLNQISVGIGTYNKDTATYFDHVSITTSGGTTTYDFQHPNPVPEPGTLVSAGIALSLMGFGALRRRRREAAKRAD